MINQNWEKIIFDEQVKKNVQIDISLLARNLNKLTIYAVTINEELVIEMLGRLSIKETKINLGFSFSKTDYIFVRLKK